MMTVLLEDSVLPRGPEKAVYRFMCVIFVIFGLFSSVNDNTVFEHLCYLPFQGRCRYM